MSDMTAHQLQAWLRAQFPKENERYEWKEWLSLKSNISGRKGEGLVSYVSALANMDGGCVVIGAQDKTLEVMGIQDFADYTPENVVHRILGKTPGLPSMGLQIEELQASDTDAIVWLEHVPRLAPRQGLHNCVAHQDYEQGGRIVVLETPGRLKLSNPGRFVDGEPEDYFTGQRIPSVYRNPWLAGAMTEIGMIDKGGYGIKEMVASQRKRYLPLPDYEGSTSAETVFNIYGQTIDENYSKLLIEHADLPLEQVIWLDRVQKKERIADEQVTVLRRKGLISGRKPNLFVSAAVAKVTNTQNQYVLNKGFDDDYYKRVIVNRLKLGFASGAELRQLVFDKLPAVLTTQEKETKVKNLRTALRLRGLDGIFIEVMPSGPGRGAGAVWRIKA